MEVLNNDNNHDPAMSDYLDIESVSLIKEWVDDPQWAHTIIRDYQLSPELKKDVLSIVQSLSEGGVDHDRLDSTLSRLRELSKDSIDLATASKDDEVDTWKKARIAYVYYGLGEAIVEGSSFSADVIADIKSDLGENYLQDLRKVDLLTPSILTKISSGVTKESLRSELIDVLDLESVKKYLVLKKWQDDQHIYHEDYLHPRFKSLRTRFSKYVELNHPNLKEESERDALFAIENLYCSQPLSLTDVAKFIKAEAIGVDSLTSSLGGKAVGLIKLLLSGAKVPSTFVVPVGIKEESIGEYIPPHEGVWAVRSSATVEDGEKTAFAGIFQSFLRVPSSGLLEHIRKVILSADSKRVADYVRQFDTDKPEMAVLIQEFRQPELAGVWMGSNSDSGHLEWVKGDGEKLVAGQVTPNHERWSLGKLVDGNPLTVGGEKVLVAKEAIKLQGALGVDTADFEFCVVDGEIIWLQFRPVTKIISSEMQEEGVRSGEFIKGMPASPGQCEGDGFVADSPEDAVDISKNKVLICDVTDPDWLSAMIKSEGIVTSEGGVLCHAAITARELGKPAVVGAGEEVLTLHDKRVSVDGSSGVVKRL